jgi:hypothetical protein
MIANLGRVSRQGLYRHPEHLGSAIGSKLIEAVPYIIGMDKYLANHHDKMGYLKDFGAGTATTGAIGLYHMEGVTPEAIDQGRPLLKDGYQTYVIDQAEYERLYKEYPILWTDPKMKPEKMVLGCPHCTYDQVKWWGQSLVDRIEEAGNSMVAVPTFILAHHAVAAHFRKDEPKLARKMSDYGIKIAHNCPMMYMSVPLQKDEIVVTNAAKTRAYTTSRLLPDDELLEIAVTGALPASRMQHDAENQAAQKS